MLHIRTNFLSRLFKAYQSRESIEVLAAIFRETLQAIRTERARLGPEHPEYFELGLMQAKLLNIGLNKKIR